MTVSIGPVADPPGAEPLFNEDVQAAQLLRRLGDHAVHLLLAGDIGREGNDAPVRIDRAGASKFPESLNFRNSEVRAPQSEVTKRSFRNHRAWYYPEFDEGFESAR